MDKIQKALAKLYFALGESRPRIPAGTEINEVTAEYFAFLAIRGSGETVGKKYFAMGAAAALRKEAKPPRGKKLRHPEAAVALPPRGKKQPAKAKKQRKGREKDHGWDVENRKEFDWKKEFYH